MYYKNYLSILGNLILVSDGINLCGLYMEGQKHFIKDKLILNNDLEIFKEVEGWLNKYFTGQNPSIDNLKIKLTGTKFQLLVWDILKTIPYGKTTTYSNIGIIVKEKLHKENMSSQAIGNAVSHNPISIIIPCHRVVGKNGSLVGYAGGLNNKIKLLELERKQNM